jgi:uncharacterized membrane protein
MRSILEIMAILGVILSVMLLGFYWSILPDKVPSHFNFAGKVDAWSGKGSILLLPLISIIIFATMSIVSRYPKLFNYPWKFKLENLIRQQELAQLLITSLKAEIVWLFALIEWGTINTAMGKIDGLGVWPLLGGVGIIMVTTVAYFISSYRAR